MSCISKIPSLFLLAKLFQDYSEVIRKTLPKEIPSLMDFLTDRGRLVSLTEQYEQLLVDQGVEAPPLDAFWEKTFLSKAIGQASDKVTDEFLKYKEQVISQGPEKVFEDSYYNHIAANIAYFFEALEDQTYLLDEESLMRILDASLRDGFFERIMDYASGCENFDVSNSSATGDGIEAYCYDSFLNEAA